MGLMLAPIEGTPYVGGNAPGFQSVSAAGLQVLVKSNLSATSDPTTSDDSGSGYRIGSRWTNAITGKVWEAVSVATLAAVWKDLTATTPPAGSGTEFQYRASATSFGAITGSSFSGGVATLPTLAVSDLTPGRMPYVGTAGRLVDSGNLTYDGTYVVLSPTYGSANRGIKSGEGINLSFRGGGYGDVGFGTDAAPWKHLVVGSDGGTTIGCRLASDGRLGWGGTQSDARYPIQVSWARYSSTAIEANNGYNSSSGGALRDVRMRSLYAVPQAITDVPINVNLYPDQTADALQVTSSGGTAGDLAKITSTGIIHSGGDFNVPDTGTHYISNVARTSGMYISSGAGGVVTLFSVSGCIGIGNYDTSLSRNAAGIVEINSGTAGQYRDILIRSIGLGVAPSGTTGGINGNVTINAASGVPLKLYYTSAADGIDVFNITRSTNGAKMFGLRSDAGSAGTGILSGVSLIEGLDRISLSSSTVDNNVAININSSNFRIGYSGSGYGSLDTLSANPIALQSIGSGGVVIGGTTAGARLHVIATTEQLRLGCNSTNYFSTTVASSGDTTFAITTGSTTNGFVFSNRATVTGVAGSKVFTLTTPATNDDPTLDTYQNRVATTDATATTLHTIAIADDTAYLITATVLARRTGGSAGTAGDSATYVRRARVKRTSGGIAVIGTVDTPWTDEDQAGWDCTLDVDGGNNARVRVTGAANNNVTFHLVKLEVSSLST